MKCELAGSGDSGVLRDKLVVVEGQLGAMSTEIENYKREVSRLAEDKLSLGRDNEELNAEVADQVTSIGPSRGEYWYYVGTLSTYH